MSYGVYLGTFYFILVLMLYNLINLTLAELLI